jgi:hypothetical protein
VVYHDATEVPEPEWEEIDEEEAIDNFVEIGEMDAIEKYVVVDLTAAK